jgi:hypothetical protein
VLKKELGFQSLPSFDLKVATYAQADMRLP